MLLTAFIWFLCICIVFSLFVLMAFRRGIVSQTRDKQGVFKKNMSLKTKMPMIVFALCIILVVLVYNHALFDATSSLLTILIWDLGLLIAVSLHDSLVIDLLVIGKIRPKVLALPDEMNMASMVKHVIKTYTVGWVFILPLSIIPAILYYLIT